MQLVRPRIIHHPTPAPARPPAELAGEQPLILRTVAERLKHADAERAAMQIQLDRVEGKVDDLMQP